MEKLSIKEKISGICVDLTYKGLGLVKYKNFNILVSGLFKDEEGEFEIQYKRADFYYAKILKLTKISPDRLQPKCKVCSACGGCSFQQLSYDAQLKFKRALVESQMRKVGKIDFPVDECEGMEDPYFYRNKIQMPFGKDNRGNIYSGFYKEGTHIIVPIDKCYIEDERATEIMNTIKKLMKSFKIEPYNEDSKRGIIRHVLIKTSHFKDEIMVVLVTNIDVFPSRKNFVKELVKLHPNIFTVVQNINSRHTNVILGNKEYVLYGKGYIEDCLCGLKFKISAKSFYQTNPVMTEKLYKTAIEFAKLTGNEVVFDAFSGIGTIGLIASKHAKKVISVEIVKDAVRDGIKNAKDNNINNVEFYCDDATSFVLKSTQKYDVLVMDPPRKGSDEKFLNAVLKAKPKRIVYVSCNPSTLARDLKYLLKDYEIEKIKPFDMFPFTLHVETIVGLFRKIKDNV